MVLLTKEMSEPSLCDQSWSRWVGVFEPLKVDDVGQSFNLGRGGFRLQRGWIFSPQIPAEIDEQLFNYY